MSRNKNPKALWKDYLETLLVAVFLALMVRTFILTGYQVPKFTMAPTLIPGDYIFSFKLPYGIQIPLWREKVFIQSPVRGDVVVFSYPRSERTLYVKRVVGVSGDRIRIENGKLWVNDLPAIYKLTQVEGVENLSGFQFFEETILKHQRKVALPFHQPQQEKTILVPQGHVFLMGDLRDLSKDEKSWQTVPIKNIEGSVNLIGLSLEWHRKQLLPEFRTHRFLADL